MAQRQMTRIVQQFEVAAPPEKVFATISVPEKWPRWSTFVKQATSNGPTAHWIYDLGGMKVQSDSEIAEVTENKVYEFRQTKGFMKEGDTRIEIHPSRKGSEVTWVTKYTLPYSYLGRLVDKLRAGKMLDKAIEDSVKNLKELLER